MSGEIKIAYSEVYSETAELRSQIEALKADVEAEYNSIQSSLDGVDSATNAALKETLEVNKQKTLLAANTIDKLLAFIYNSTVQMEAAEQDVKSVFDSSPGQ